MKYAMYLIKLIMVPLSTYLITWWWLGTAWSERYWTWLNNVFGGQKLGLASDVELVTVLFVALLASIGVGVLVTRSIQYIYKR